MGSYLCRAECMSGGSQTSYPFLTPQPQQPIYRGQIPNWNVGSWLPLPSIHNQPQDNSKTNLCVSCTRFTFPTFTAPGFSDLDTAVLTALLYVCLSPLTNNLSPLIWASPCCLLCNILTFLFCPTEMHSFYLHKMIHLRQKLVSVAKTALSFKTRLLSDSVAKISL